MWFKLQKNFKTDKFESVKTYVHKVENAAFEQIGIKSFDIITVIKT
jgi:hypothetical protein